MGMCLWTCSLLPGQISRKTSDVLTSNASLSALVPSPLIPLPACSCCVLTTITLIQNHNCFLTHMTDSVIGVLCLSSMPRSVLLLLLLQSCCLLVGVGCWQCLQFINLPRLLLAHIQDSVIGVLCLSSMHRSVLLLLLLQ